jgi:multidrug resistance efflux pump
MELQKYMRGGLDVSEAEVDSLWTPYAVAQRALDAEREKVKRLSTCGTDHSTPWWQVKCEDLEAQLATIRADNECKDSLIETLQAQIRQVEGERDQWIAANTKEPINEPVTYQALAGARFVAKRAFDELVKARSELSTLRQLVEALPVVTGAMSLTSAPINLWGIVSTTGHRIALVESIEMARALFDVFTYRATLAAQDAGKGAGNG